MGKKNKNKTDIIDITTGSSNSLCVQSVQISNCTDTELVSFYDRPTLGDVWNVYVMRIDSFNSFYVQKVNNFNYFQQICSEFDNNSITVNKTFPKLGDLVVTRDENNFWCRARVTAKKETELFVHFVDRGISNIITEFKNLPKEFTMKQSLFHRCILKNLPTENAEILMKPDFLYLIWRYFEREMTVTFLNKYEPYFITLSHNNRDVLDVLSELIWDGIVPGLIHDSIYLAKYEMLNKMISSHQNKVVCIEPIISIKHFYVETEISHEIHKIIRTKIDNTTNWIPVLHPNEGEIVIAKNPLDNNLYRARVLLNYENSDLHKCFLIDCGIFVDCAKFFKPCNYLSTAPPVKIHCSLNGLDKIKVSLLESMTLSFIDELAYYSNDLKTIKNYKIGSPCIVDIIIKGFKISKVIKPIKVTVIDIKNINSFIVRVDSTGMRKITDVLKCVKKLSIASHPIIFQLYVAKINGHYKRVKYLWLDDSGFEIVLMDESPIKHIVNELFELPKSIQDVQTLDIYCSLELNNQEYSNKKFINLCADCKTKFEMVVIKKEFDYHIVKLFLKSKDVATMICN